MKFFPFEIYCSLFDLPAMPLIGLEIVFLMLMNNTVNQAHAWQAGVLRFY